MRHSKIRRCDNYASLSFWSILEVKGKVSDLFTTLCRWRLAFGNAQILKSKAFLSSRKLCWRQKLGLVARLIAWCDFNFPPNLSPAFYRDALGMKVV